MTPTGSIASWAPATIFEKAVFRTKASAVMAESASQKQITVASNRAAPATTLESADMAAAISVATPRVAAILESPVGVAAAAHPMSTTAD